ncbi:fumarylacetoacetate hydrolase family protein [Micromonospora sp. NPDC049366]|uniref:fumarylacetoacetate hydrolase family protein n=1 Tax=Micromonospora sp. NPDC049366 TaxID=3364271 RepID=UPI0037AEB8D6
MYVRRRLGAGQRLITEVRQPHEEEWRFAEPDAALGYVSPFAPEWEAARAAEHAAEGDVVLPFQPLSFRDFLLYEEHNVGVARGWVRRFRPAVARLATAFEFTTRRTFPLFRPRRLWYQQPIYYMGNAATVVPSGTPVRGPSYTTALDYELELAFVLNAPLLDASPAEAEQAIGAFAVLCDFSARDVQVAEMGSNFGPQKAKHFLTSLSATAVTAGDILPRWRELAATVEINGEVVAKPDPTHARWTLGEMLAHASSGERLLPGEVFATGTYVNGSGIEINRWLRPGDTLRLAVDQVGAIEHRIMA